MSFHSRFWTLTLAMTALMSTAGCVCVNNNNGGRGDITFTWNFNGSTCAFVPDVTSVVVTIPGQTLENGGVYGCTNGRDRIAGIVVENFAPGTYDYTIAGRNSAGQTLYEASGRLTVNGSIAVDVTLMPTGSAKGSTRFFWTFPNGSGVDCSVISAVDIWVNGAVIQTSNCLQGFAGNVNTPAGPGVVITGITPGQNQLTLTAADNTGFYYYRSDRNFTAVAGGETSENTTLEWAVGSLPVKWTFSDGAQQLTCESAGITSVFVNLRDSTGQLLYDGAGFETGCRNNNGVQGVLFTYLYAGQYEIVVQATDGFNRLYSTNQQNAPRGNVVSGSFPDIDNPSPTQIVVLAR